MHFLIDQLHIITSSYSNTHTHVFNGCSTSFCFERWLGNFALGLPCRWSPGDSNYFISCWYVGGKLVEVGDFATLSTNSNFTQNWLSNILCRFRKRRTLLLGDWEMGEIIQWKLRIGLYRNVKHFSITPPHWLVNHGNKFGNYKPQNDRSTLVGNYYITEYSPKLR